MWPWKKNDRFRVLDTDSVGTLGEKLGCCYLEEKGYRVLTTNFQNPLGRRLGEIDIIAQKGKKVVFVEVKTRTRTNFGHPVPEENINRGKLRKLEKIAEYYLREKKLFDREWAFDALAIEYDPLSKKAEIRHLEVIFF